MGWRKGLQRRRRRSYPGPDGEKKLKIKKYSNLVKDLEMMDIFQTKGWGVVGVNTQSKVFIKDL